MKVGADVTTGILAFEQGELSDAEVDDLFQYLLDTGMVWNLQGFYGRTARMLLEAGRIHRRDEKVN